MLPEAALHAVTRQDSGEHILNDFAYITELSLLGRTAVGKFVSSKVATG